MAAPLQAIGTLGVPVTALPSGGLRPACARRGVPSREAAETHPCRIHVWHCPGAPRTSLDPLRDVGAVQVGAAVGAEVVACLYVDHHVSAHGTLLSLACSHPLCAGIRFILLILADTALAAIRLMRACARVAVCLPRSQTRATATTPRSGGTKIFTKLKPLSIFNLLNVFYVWDGRWGYHP